MNCLLKRTAYLVFPSVFAGLDIVSFDTEIAVLQRQIYARLWIERMTFSCYLRLICALEQAELRLLWEGRRLIL